MRQLASHKKMVADFEKRVIAQALERLYPDRDEWVNGGDSVVIAPGGDIVAGPLRKEEGILYCEIDVARAAVAKRALDVVGHYSRPDIFKLHINTQPQSPVEIE